jgi:formylglycine-generating enzyme required for sulfatase activity
MPHHVRVFIASPSDLHDERKAAAEVLRGLQNAPAWKGKFTIEPVGWEDASMSASVPPQEAVLRNVPKPSECDITIVMFWKRMGTPVVGLAGAGGETYQSGTHWEFLDAAGSGKPLLIYRKTANAVSPNDPNIDEAFRLLKEVNAFFESFTQPDGSLTRYFHPFSELEEFKGKVAHDVERELRVIEGPGAGRDTATKSVRLRTPQPLPDWPVDPYPLLGPYTRPELFGGRDEELRTLDTKVKEPRLILCVHAPSGAGKSSLLQAGLVPRLREQGYPVFFEREATSGQLAWRIASSLLELPGPQPQTTDADTPVRFARWMTEAHQLAGKPPILILDQVDDFLRDEGLRDMVLGELGPLLAATMHRVPGRADYPCRWVLCCRRDFKGWVDDWLQNPLEQAQRARVADLPTLPRDGLRGPDQYSDWSLPLMGKSHPGQFEPQGTGKAAFLSAVLKPLQIKDGAGRLRYAERFDGDGADRLAKAFANARDRRPSDALVPELQAVLSHLREKATMTSGGLVLSVPDSEEELGKTILDALLDHVRRAFERVFPFGRDHTAAKERRGRALLALRELADAQGLRGTLLEESKVVEAIGVGHAGEAAAEKSARDVLHELEGAGARLIVRETRNGVAFYGLSHDRLAEVISRAVDTGVLGALEFDRELVDLHRFVGQRADLFVRSKDDTALELKGDQFERVERDERVLIGLDVTRATWWKECRTLYTDLDAVQARPWPTPGDRVAAIERVVRRRDPRFREDAWWLAASDRLGFIEVPGGKFPMGSDPAVDAESFPDEHPCHSMDVGLFYVARWPVTVAQFRAFVEDRKHNNGFAPGDPGCLRSDGSHPVVRVSWHEARAYCAWLTGRLAGWKETPKDLVDRMRGGWRVQLPTEPQWEKAARGTDGRVFPWGPDPDPNKANYMDSDVGRPCAVGCFWDGASPFKVEDMAGNVWEWTRSLWGHDEQTTEFGYAYVPTDGREDESASDEVRRVLRGGAFVSPSRLVRCAYRIGSPPLNRYPNVGFRLVVSPGS